MSEFNAEIERCDWKGAGFTSVALPESSFLFSCYRGVGGVTGSASIVPRSNIDSSCGKKARTRLYARRIAHQCYPTPTRSVIDKSSYEESNSVTPNQNHGV